jgi:hypothetical protein
MSGKPSSVTGRKHACRALIGAAASAGEMFRHSASIRPCAPCSDATSAGSTGTGPTVEIAHTHVVPSARGNSSGVRILPLASRYLIAAAVEVWVGSHQQRSGLQLQDSRKRGVDLAFVAGPQSNHLATDSAGGSLGFSCLALAKREARIHETREERSRRH